MFEHLKIIQLSLEIMTRKSRLKLIWSIGMCDLNLRTWLMLRCFSLSAVTFILFCHWNHPKSSLRARHSLTNEDDLKNISIRNCRIFLLYYMSVYMRLINILTQHLHVCTFRTSLQQNYELLSPPGYLTHTCCAGSRTMDNDVNLHLSFVMITVQFV